MFSIFKKCLDLGLKPVCGTDAGTNGTFFEETWLETALMTERGGLRPEEAIRVCTEQTAQALGLAGVTGSLREGLQADIVVLPGNPLEDIHWYARPLQVFQAGLLLQRRVMNDGNALYGLSQTIYRTPKSLCLYVLRGKY